MMNGCISVSFNDMEGNNENLSLYDCATLFAESMHEKFPGGCPKGTATLLISTNGKKMAYLLEGPDSLAVHMISQLCVMDEEVRNVLGEGLVNAINHLKNEKHDPVDKSIE